MTPKAKMTAKTKADPQAQTKKTAFRGRPTGGKQNNSRQTILTKSSGVFPFQKLPAELRIKVYNLVFEKRILEILPRTKGSGLASWDGRRRKARPSVHKQRSPLTRGQASKPGPTDKRAAKWSNTAAVPGLAALLLTCKQIYQETVHLLYGQVTFVFKSQTVLQRFVSTLSPLCLASIRSLKLQHHTYGEPYLNENLVWKEKYDSKWAALLQEAAPRMTGLRNLEIKLSICDWPTELNLTAVWALPLLEFAGRQLEKVKIELEMEGRGIEKKQLRACAAVLERELVIPGKRSDVGGARRNGGLPRAIRCLRIT